MTNYAKAEIFLFADCWDARVAPLVGPFARFISLDGCEYFSAGFVIGDTDFTINQGENKKCLINILGMLTKEHLERFFPEKMFAICAPGKIIGYGKFLTEVISLPEALELFPDWFRSEWERRRIGYR